MRILVGIACLIGLFLLSSRWHGTRMEQLHGTRQPGSTVLANDMPVPEPGKGVITIGKPSGARPVFLEPTGLEELSRDRENEATAAGAEKSNGIYSGELGDWEMRIRPGDVLSRIVKVHYGRVSRDLEHRLARYNKIADPDRLVVGQLLYLPTEERLIQKTR